LELREPRLEPDGHVLTGTLSCRGCSRTFPVARGVPRLVADHAAGEVGETIDGFGYQWNHATDVFESRMSSADVFLDFIHPVQREWFQGKAVLDVGCGSGRFSIQAAGFGARAVIGVDLSSAVDVAFARTRHMPEVLIVQADVLQLPVQPRIDYAFSVGVLHHTADPRGGFLQMASKVRPGGGVSAWVYGAENNQWVVRVISPLRAVTSRLPRRVLLVLAYLVAVPLTLATHCVYGPVSRRPSFAWIRRRLFYFDYLVFLSQFDYRGHALIVFDHAVPAIAEYIPRDAFAEWFRAARLDQVTITSRASNSWRGFGRVPA
jgi:SAM-dependent methyltransferase